MNRLGTGLRIFAGIFVVAASPLMIYTFIEPSNWYFVSALAVLTMIAAYVAVTGKAPFFSQRS